MKREGTEYRREFYKASQETAYLLATMKTPAFACMQGLTMGLGAGLTGHSLFRVVTGDVQWSVPNVLYGAIPGNYLFISIVYSLFFVKANSVKTVE